METEKKETNIGEITVASIGTLILGGMLVILFYNVFKKEKK